MGHPVSFSSGTLASCRSIPSSCVGVMGPLLAKERGGITLANRRSLRLEGGNLLRIEFADDRLLQLALCVEQIAGG